MKKKKYPYLYVLPQKEILKPSWEEKAKPSAVNEQAIRRQMDKLRGISGAVLLSTILLEVCIWQLVAALNHSMGISGTIAFVAAALAVGLFGGILFFLTASVAEAVRRNLHPTEAEDEEHV